MAALRKTTRKLPPHIEEKLRAGKCMHKGCDSPLYSRGCCQKHINQFWSTIRTCRTEEARLVAERKCVKGFLILERDEVRKYRKDDPFSKAVG